MSRLLHRPLAEEPLTAEDWREIWNFQRHVWVPFAEAIVARARARLAKELPTDGGTGIGKGVTDE
jgi:hypothetical protein